MKNPVPAFARLFTVLLLVTTGSAMAAVQNIQFTAYVVDTDPGITAFSIGDEFTFNITLEDSTTDTNASIGAGTFPTLVTSAVVSAFAGNQGSWNPSGTFDQGLSNFVTNAFGNSFTLQLRGNGYPDGGPGWEFGDFDLNFNWPPGVSDSGTGDTFLAQLGGPVSIPPATLNMGIRFTDGDDFPQAVLSLEPPPRANPVPVSSTWAIALMVLLLTGFAWTRMRRKAA